MMLDFSKCKTKEDVDAVFNAHKGEFIVIRRTIKECGEEGGSNGKD